MTQIATTLEQSKHLLEIGVPKETADMRWERDTVGVASDDIATHDLRVGGYCGTYDTPAWSLSALIGLLPQQIVINKYLGSDQGEIDEEYKLWFDFRDDGTVGYGYGDFFFDHADNLFEAVINLIYWLIDCGEELNTEEQ